MYHLFVEAAAARKAAEDDDAESKGLAADHAVASVTRRQQNSHATLKTAILSNIANNPVLLQIYSVVPPHFQLSLVQIVANGEKNISAIQADAFKWMTLATAGARRYT